MLADSRFYLLYFGLAQAVNMLAMCDIGHSSKETGSSQDYILMPLWKDGSLFDSSSKNASNDEPQPSSDDEGVNKESGIDDQERPENSTQDVNTVGPSINTASTNVNTGSLNINMVSGVQTRRMTKTTNEQGFISAIYEGKTHEDLHTCYVCLFPISGRAQKGNPSMKRSKLDRSYARRASAVQVTTGMDLGGFTPMRKKSALVLNGCT
ncbi:hypothetical protein Tco_0695396 [Tanacetum coccineum]